MNTRKTVKVGLATLILLIAFGSALISLSPDPRKVAKQRGVSWVAGEEVTQEDLTLLRERKIDWIVQTPFGWQQDYNSTGLALVTDGGIFWGERDVGIATTAGLARAVGIKTMLKPHIWLRNMSGGKWRGEIAMETEEAWQSWFSSYRNFILHYAKLAEENQIEALCLGTELRLAATLREQDWRAIIKEVLAVYSGKLTYAANWYLEFEEVKFWDALDFIGIQAYFPLSDTTNPSLDELMRGWSPHKTVIDSISTHYNKPVVFTEIGYKSTIETAIEPWQWPTHPLEEASEADLAVQERCYEAFFQTFWREDWCAGAYFWKWFPRIRNSEMYRNFTPQNKPAEKVMAKWYSSTED